MIFARFSRPSARLLFADNPVISNHEGQLTLHGLDAADLEAVNAGLGLFVSGYDDVAAQTVHARKSYEHSDIRFGHRYAEIDPASDRRRRSADRLRSVPRDDRRMNTTSARIKILGEKRGEHAKYKWRCDRTDSSEDAAANFLG
ncbi:hypothetical protein ABIB82_002294 [Bradyrhizobium sp. i1.8.4]|uniref:hypothetical protein n=1 Tax=unclassified Bradyrhizobium TaxID=2631580 RepID=UPI003D1D01D2